MLFNSHAFIFVFLPLTLVVYFIFLKTQKLKSAALWLTVASFAFYSYWNLFPPEGQTATPQYFILIILSIIFNHQVGAAIAEAELGSKRAKALLILGIIANLSLIAYYKYANFILDSFNYALHTSWFIPNLILPLGISFYTFTQIGYLVDAYRGETKGQKYDLITYSLFITFFPQLIAGPILRHDELIPELRNRKNFILNFENLAKGLTWFSLGLAKKVLLADTLSPWVAAGFANVSSLNFTEAWVTALSYTLQLYFDFSGYSDMAIGLGLMFNFKLPLNFDSPYKALSITDFWRRWHITLSNFLRDYLYIPLGGNRLGVQRRYFNLMTTMLIGGLWHGAGWTFVLWGGLHGLYLCINHAWRNLNLKLPTFVGWLVTFLAVIAAWVLFRAVNLTDALVMLKTMAGLDGITIPGVAQGKLAFLNQVGISVKNWSDFSYLPKFYGNSKNALLYIGALLLVVKYAPNTQEIMAKFKPTWWWALPLGLIASLSILSLSKVSEFLYFQF